MSWRNKLIPKIPFHSLNHVDSVVLNQNVGQGAGYRRCLKKLDDLYK